MPSPFILQVEINQHTLTATSYPFIVYSASLDEWVSKPFELKLHFAYTQGKTPLKENEGIKAQSKVKITLKYGGRKRYFHGYVSQIDKGRSAGSLAINENKKIDKFWNVNVMVNPGFHFTRFNARYQIFTNKTTKEIVKTVLGEYKTLEDLKNLVVKKPGSHRAYCVQYGESDFDFVSRLLEEEGWYYYFKHDNEKCQMCIADGAHDYIKKEAKKDIIVYSADKSWGKDKLPGITSCISDKQFVIGKYTVKDHDYRNASLKLEKSQHKKGVDAKLYVYQKFRAFFGFKDKKRSRKGGENMAKNYLEARRVNQERLQAEGYVADITPGNVYTIDKLPERLAAKKKTKFVIAEAHHFYSRQPTEDYSNTFYFHDSGTVLRPKLETPRPLIYGCQTAKVITKSATDEIDEDKEGRIKVLFHWQDHETEQKAYDAATYVRVAQMIAGHQWGAQFTPRKGQEVVVTFIDGNPDRPLIIGSVYNSINKPPHFPKTANGIRTHSTTKGSDKEYNEILFDDKKGKEKFKMHAQNEMEIVVDKGDQKITLNEKSQTTTIKKGNCTIEVEKGTVTIKAQNIKFEATKKVHISGQEVEVAAKTNLKLSGATSTLSGKGKATVSATTVSVSGKAKSEVTGATVSIKGKGMAELNGGAMTQVKGAMVKIG